MRFFYIRTTIHLLHSSGCLVTKSCLTLSWPHGLWPTRLLCPWNFPGQNTGMGCHFLLQGTFLTQGVSPHLFHLLHWKMDSLPLSHLLSSCIKSVFPKYLLFLRWKVLCILNYFLDLLVDFHSGQSSNSIFKRDWMHLIQLYYHDIHHLLNIVS